MLKKSLALAVSALGLSYAARSGLELSPLASKAAIIFSDDFQASTLKPQWSTNSKLNREAEQTFTWFSGRYSAENIALTLPGVPPPKSAGNNNDGGGKYNLFTLTFDLFIIDSWDGLEPANGPDRFIVKANTVERFNEAFSNVGTTQTYRRPDIGPVQLGFDGRYNDSIYRKVAIDFTVPDNQDIKLEFRGTALQGLTDESWGMDNVQVSYKVVPAPGAMGLAGLGGVLLLGRRKR